MGLPTHRSSVKQGQLFVLSESYLSGSALSRADYPVFEGYTSLADVRLTWSQERCAVSREKKKASDFDTCMVSMHGPSRHRE